MGWTLPFWQKDIYLSLPHCHYQHTNRFSPSLGEAMTGGRDKKPNRAVFGRCSVCSGWEEEQRDVSVSCKEKELLWPCWHVQRMRLPQCRVRSTDHTVGEAFAEVGRVNNASSVARPGHLCACGEDSWRECWVLFFGIRISDLVANHGKFRMETF